MTKIDLVPFGGLGNRMRVLNSAIFLGKETKLEISVCWFKKAELYADFHEIFETAGCSIDFKKGLKNKIWQMFFKQIYIFKYPRFYKFLLSFFYDEIILDKDLIKISQIDLKESLKNKKRVLIATCYEFFPFPDFNNFKLNYHLIDKINYFEVNKSYIGIHIRRTDHLEIKSESTLENYYEELDNQLKINPNVRFYLATDDFNTKRDFLEKYQGRVKVQDVSLERTSEEGIFGAVIDIYNLSRCSKIICNPKSSFAVMASKIGSIKPIIKV
ncbi:MAG: hypothetical protein IPQ23_01795 [Cytophagaceae bacterium]|nr:hypothetical protein [Cytophagaceae bacterium]